jgi:hypothetical protein
VGDQGQTGSPRPAVAATPALLTAIVAAAVTVVAIAAAMWPAAAAEAEPRSDGRLSDNDETPPDSPVLGGDDAPVGPVDTEAPTVSGLVTDGGGHGVGGEIIDLFGDDSDGDRGGGYVGSTTTTHDGSFTLELPDVGCYRLEFWSRAAASVTTSGRRSSRFCTDGDGNAHGLLFDSALGETPTGRIIGRVAYETGASAREVVVEFFMTAGDGSRGPLVRSLATRPDGSFRLDVTSGCYVVVVIAPGAERVSGSGRHGRRDVCIDAGVPSAPVRVTLEGDAPQTTSLSSIELEILRLTNELRADPGGPLRREKPLPSCVSDAFYRIGIDPETGQPASVPPLEMSETTSNGLARSWAIEMARTGRFRHRPSAAQQQIYASLDVPVTAWGENIAWFTGFSVADTARIHFEGWRESETGHFCTLVTGRFSHVGIGEFRVGDESWAVQNFHTIGPPAASRTG